MEFQEEGTSSQNEEVRTDLETQHHQDMNDQADFSDMQEDDYSEPQKQEENEGEEQQDLQQEKQNEQEEQLSPQINSQNEQKSVTSSDHLKSAEIPITILKQKLRIIDQAQPFESNAEPSKEEIQECLMNMQSIFPKGQVVSVIEDLHKILHFNCVYTKFKAYRNRVNMLQTIDISGPGKQSDQVKVANSFINYGYGQRILRQRINDPNMSTGRYNVLVSNVVKITFRRLEELMTVFGKQIKPICRDEERLLRSPLINIDKWIPEDQLDTFYKLIKHAYQIEKMLVTPQAAEKLYNSIMKQLQQRVSLQLANKYNINPKLLQTGKKPTKKQ